MIAGRWMVVAVVLSLLAGGLALDLGTSKPLNPFRSPPLVALGSGEAAGGAHCTAVPAD